MKKRLFVVLAAFILVFSITACGSNVQEYAGFYSAAIPDGFVADEYETEFTRESDAFPGEKDIIQVYVSNGSAEDEITRSIDFWDGDHQRVDDVTHNGITWKVETFEWLGGDAPSCTFYTDTEDGHYIEVTIFLLAYDDEEVVAFMDSFSFVEGAYDKSYEFMWNVGAEEE